MPGSAPAPARGAAECGPERIQARIDGSGHQTSLLLSTSAAAPGIWWLAAPALALALGGCIDWDSLSTNFTTGSGGGDQGGSATGGSTTGGGGASGGSGPYCASLSPTPTLCNDFDDVGPLVDWSTAIDPPGGSVDVDESVSRSAPASLRAQIPAGGDQFFSATITHAAGVTASEIVLGMDLRIEQGNDEPTLVGAVRFAWDPECGVGIEIIDGGARAVHWEDTTSTPFSFGELGPPDTWSRVELRYVATAPSTISLSIDGIPVYENVAAPSCEPAQPDLAVGINYTPPNTGWIVNIDNLFFDAL
ncbi:MAG: hypothetical protein HOW73_04970 [Polyangiaceae bacterium]|nr:hypothetical protein [Polyangiaceae bacterium]